MRLFVTGGSGCVGHYLMHHFLAQPDVEIVALLRNPSKLNLPSEYKDRVTVLEGDMTQGAELLAGQAPFDLAILAATAWGGAAAFDVTVGANIAIADKLIDIGCPRIIYFATASVLNRDLTLLDEARDHGTEYIRSKYQLVEEIEKRADRTHIVGFFPTVIFGGGEQPINAPRSHLVNILFDNRRWLPLARRLSVMGKLHLIHPGDIATLAAHFGADRGTTKPERIVLGNEAVTVDNVIADVAHALGTKHRPWIRITESRVELAAKVFRIKMTPWDRYNAQNSDQSYPMAVMPADFGLPMMMPDFASGLRSVGLGAQA